MVKYGIADAHGIESYFDERQADKQRKFILFLRANCNRQRHAVMYMADVDEKTNSVIEKKIKGKDWKGALRTLKKKAISIAFPKDAIGYEKSWKLIPNPKLDPWR
jgi:hypothetical protein